MMVLPIFDMNFRNDSEELDRARSGLLWDIMERPPAPAMDDSASTKAPSVRCSSVASQNSTASAVSLTRRPRARTRSRTVTGASSTRAVDSQLPYLDKELVQDPLPQSPDNVMGPPPTPKPYSSATPTTQNTDLAAAETTFVETHSPVFGKLVRGRILQSLLYSDPGTYSRRKLVSRRNQVSLPFILAISPHPPPSLAIPPTPPMSGTQYQRISPTHLLRYTPFPPPAPPVQSPQCPPAPCPSSSTIWTRYASTPSLRMSKSSTATTSLIASNSSSKTTTFSPRPTRNPPHRTLLLSLLRIPRSSSPSRPLSPFSTSFARESRNRNHPHRPAHPILMLLSRC